VQIVDETGFDPVDVGSLDHSWRVQPSTPAYCCDYDADQTKAAVATAVRGLAEKKRDEFVANLDKIWGGDETHESVVDHTRKFNAVR